MSYFHSRAVTTGLACALGLFASAGASAATFDGATIRGSAAFPTLSGPTTAGPVDRVVGAGVEFVNGDFRPFSGPSFDFGGSTITITHSENGHLGGTFNGYTFTDLNDSLADFGSFSVLSDSTGFFSGDPSRIFFDADTLFINFQDLSFATADEQIVLEVGFDTAVVPLPATLVLLIGALGTLGAVGARGRRKGTLPA